MDHSRLHARARTKGVNPIVYWLMRAWLQPFAHIYWRLSRIGREHVPQSGPVIFVCNHRCFIDPFIIGLCSRRPIYYVAKEELFKNRLLGWFISSLGAFPVRRGAADGDMIETAKAILKRGDPVLIFPEGTRTRPGALGKPKRGVGRLALETGATVVPVAMIGTEAIRKGLRIRPHKIRVRDRRAAELPAGRLGHEPARRRGHRPHLAERDAPVGVARRPAAAPPRRRHRRRRVGHRRRGHARPLRRRGRARLPHQGPGRPDGRHAREPALPARRPAPGQGPPGQGLGARARPARPGGVRRARRGAAAGDRRARAQVRPAYRRAGALQGPRAAARHAPVELRRRAHPRLGGRRPRRPRARRRRAQRRREPRRWPPRIRPSAARSPRPCAPPACA